MNFMGPINFTLSMAQWAAAGCPTRSPEWVKEIFETHCRPCEFYKPGRNLLGQKGYCQKCGCHVSDDPDNPVNKIVNPNNSCPLDKPRWRSTVENREQRLAREQQERENNGHDL